MDEIKKKKRGENWTPQDKVGNTILIYHFIHFSASKLLGTPAAVR